MYDMKGNLIRVKGGKNHKALISPPRKGQGSQRTKGDPEKVLAGAKVSPLGFGKRKGRGKNKPLVKNKTKNGTTKKIPKPLLKREEKERSREAVVLCEGIRKITRVAIQFELRKRQPTGDVPHGTSRRSGSKSENSTSGLGIHRKGGKKRESPCTQKKKKKKKKYGRVDLDNAPPTAERVPVKRTKKEIVRGDLISGKNKKKGWFSQKKSSDDGPARQGPVDGGYKNDCCPGPGMCVRGPELAKKDLGNAFEARVTRTQYGSSPGKTHLKGRKFRGGRSAEGKLSGEL